MIPAKVVLLGAAGSGKSSLLHQFVAGPAPDGSRLERCAQHWHDGVAAAGSAVRSRKHVHYTSAVLNGKLYEMQLTDTSGSPGALPVNALDEWDGQWRGLGIRSATGYVVVYDASRLRHTLDVAHEVVHHIRACRPTAPIVIAGSKYDAVEEGDAQKNCDEAANCVAKQWRCAHVFCSALRHWHVADVFRSLLMQIDEADDSVAQSGQAQRRRSSAGATRVGSFWRRNASDNQSTSVDLLAMDTVSAAGSLAKSMHVAPVVRHGDNDGRCRLM